MYSIEATKLSKNYGSLKAVESLTLKIKPNTFFGFLGPNGAGKTTTIKMLTGQLKPSEGSAKVLGINVPENPVLIRELVGIVPEQGNPPSFLSAREYLQFVCKVRKLDDMDGKCDFWLDFLEFGPQQDIMCKDLSRGTKQKLMVAQAFIHEPKLVFIDEPLINLDPVIQKKLKDYLKDYVKDATIFLSTHVLEIAEELCDEIGIIYKGRLIVCGSMEKIKKKKESLEDAFLRLVKNV